MGEPDSGPPRCQGVVLEDKFLRCAVLVEIIVKRIKRNGLHREGIPLGGDLQLDDLQRVVQRIGNHIIVVFLN